MNTDRKRPTPEQSQGEAAIAELSAVAAPIVAWIRENYGYNTEVHVSADFVCVKHDGIGLPFPIKEK